MNTLLEAGRARRGASPGISPLLAAGRARKSIFAVENGPAPAPSVNVIRPGVAPSGIRTVPATGTRTAFIPAGTFFGNIIGARQPGVAPSGIRTVPATGTRTAFIPAGTFFGNIIGAKQPGVAPSGIRTVPTTGTRTAFISSLLFPEIVSPTRATPSVISGGIGGSVISSQMPFTTGIIGGGGPQTSPLMSQPQPISAAPVATSPIDTFSAFPASLLDAFPTPTFSGTPTVVGGGGGVTPLSAGPPSAGPLGAGPLAAGPLGIAPVASAGGGGGGGDIGSSLGGIGATISNAVASYAPLVIKIIIIIIAIKIILWVLKGRKQ